MSWAASDPAVLPTKADHTFLLDHLPPPPLRVLDLGCGAGALPARLSAMGYAVVGLDVNAGAVALAREAAPGAAFHVADALDPLELGAFDVVVCQLVLSIVGDALARGRLLANAAGALRPGGRLILSASGISDDINPEYERLYAQDLPLTGEPYTYLSRDASGAVLYTTHHFSEPELRAMLETAGFQDIALERRRESSSRRPEAAAWFFYVSATRGLA